ncbi:MAG TPA: hypothetical protein VHL80_11930 [Polyangia bacterium]|nr:hypothetical protein [Polyangia bacterium]
MALAIVGTAFVTALAAAQMAAKTDDAAMSRTIAQQQVAAGQVPAAVKDKNKPISPDEMLAGAETYEQEFNRTLEHAEAARASARRSRDIIRTTCVEDKVGQMKQVMAIAKPRLTTIKGLTGDEFHMRAQYTILREGAERMRQLNDELEQCAGDTAGSVGDIRLEDERNGPGSSITDPTLPATPGIDVQRPGQASPYL